MAAKSKLTWELRRAILRQLGVRRRLAARLITWGKIAKAYKISRRNLMNHVRDLRDDVQ